MIELIFNLLLIIVDFRNVLQNYQLTIINLGNLKKNITYQLLIINCFCIFAILKQRPMKFSDQDKQQLQQLNISEQLVETQIHQFQQGFTPSQLLRPATPDDGILVLDDNLKTTLSAPDFGHLKIVKFVPASGAASRMFKSLFEVMDELKTNQRVDLGDKNSINSPAYFFNNIQKFAFFDALKNSMKDNNIDINSCIKTENYLPILEFLLTDKGLNYANMPKALIFFHKEKDKIRFAVEEHLVEGAKYAENKGEVNIHFTVSPEHLTLFEQSIQLVKQYYEQLLQVHFNISYSIQKPSTDTIAVYMDNQPVRDNNGKLLFRQGGHGALIENLKDIDGDIIFIKNIDNITTDNNRKDTVLYKKIIASILLNFRQKIYEYLEMLENNTVDDEQLNAIYAYCEKNFMITIRNFSLLSQEEKQNRLFAKLNRPIRICGMVKNEGEPGGGPFWVDAAGEQSLQIVESSQVDLNIPAQKEIWSKATHFNPVDIVCCIKDFKGNTFDLNKFIDANTGFISKKSFKGKDIKALELPGLWNGAMADWTTLFVEVPVSVFSPVKIVNDLLRKEHQNV